jgi:hypothetical protein
MLAVGRRVQQHVAPPVAPEENPLALPLKHLCQPTKTRSVFERHARSVDTKWNLRKALALIDAGGLFPIIPEPPFDH